MSISAPPTISTRIRRALMATVRAGAARLGEDVLKRSYHSPVVHVEDLPPDAFERRDPMLGIHFEVEDFVARLRELSSSVAEFVPPSADFFDNIMYGSLDAEFLHAMVRSSKPRRVVELGSGSTSLVIAHAHEMNARDGAPRASIRVFDPYPSQLLTGVAAIDSVEALRPEQIEFARFTELEDGDILFVDTTHTVKVGSEVNFIVLEVLPKLASGVHVHFHDIFLPYAYPVLYLKQHLFYVEQYLLQAFLAYNPNYVVTFASHPVARQHMSVVRELVPSAPAGMLPAGPSALWIRRLY